MQRSQFDLSVVLLVAAFGLLAHVAVGYWAFPQGDDFAYAPLASYRADPTLFAADDQLRLFANHARAYEWVYLLGESGPGVEPVFRWAVWSLAIACTVFLWLILRGLGAPLAALPLVLGLGVATQIDGMGRGDYGGVISPFFHHHNIALAAILAAAAAALHRRGWLAGIALGIAAYGQPMTALHGAMVVGMGALFMSPREVPKMALAAIIVALPAAWLVSGALTDGGAGAAMPNPVEDAYRFRAPAHYDPPWPAIVICSLYLLCGWVGAALFALRSDEKARFVSGMMLAFSLLLLVTVVVYKGRMAEFLPFFILDANRSSSLLFVLGPASLVAATFSASMVARVSAVMLGCAILYLNGTPEGMILIACAAILFVLEQYRWGVPMAAAGALVALAFVFPPEENPESVPIENQKFYAKVRAETDRDALFVAPISLVGFRHFTHRSTYVDFKLFSVAQPDQAALTRLRIDQVTKPNDADPDAIGWRGAILRDDAQWQVSTCDRMREILVDTGADYYVRLRAPDEVLPECSDLPRPIESESLALYGPLG